MKRVSKKLYYSVILGLSLTVCQPVSAFAAEYFVPITGGEDPAYAGVRTGNDYLFTDDTVITVNKDIAVSFTDAEGGAKKYSISNPGKTLTFNAKEDTVADDTIKRMLQALKLRTNDLTVSAKTINLNAISVGQARTEALTVGSGNLAFNGDVNLQSINSINSPKSKEVAIGIHGTGGNITINGNFTAGDAETMGVNGRGGGFGYYGSAVLYAHGGGRITVNGDVMIHGHSNGLFVNMTNGKIDINGGGTIIVDNNNKNGYAALRAECGVVNMNVKKDEFGNVTGSGDKDVTIKGNVAVTTGAIFPSDPGIYSVVNLGLGTAKSSLRGVIYNAFNRNGSVNNEAPGGNEVKFFGNTNLWLLNGATWYNEAYGKTGGSYFGNGYKGGIVSNFYGGNDEASAGIIFQNESNPINVYKYSGYAKLFYAHDEQTPTIFNGGDFIIESAAANSHISVLTDPSGLKPHSSDKTEQRLVTDTLNALAQKLVYKFYAKGEKNLTGSVGIAEGLTASSATIRLEDIVFDKSNGRGFLKENSVKTDFTTTLTGSMASDQEYKDAGILSKDNEAVFTSPVNIQTTNLPAVQPQSGSTLMIDAKANELSIAEKVTGTQGYGIAANAAAINVKDAGAVTIKGQGNLIGIASLSAADHTGENGSIRVVGAGPIAIFTSDTGILSSGYASKKVSWGTRDYGSSVNLKLNSEGTVITNTKKDNAAFTGLKVLDKGVIDISGSLAVDSGKGRAIFVQGKDSKVSISGAANLQSEGKKVIEVADEALLTLRPGLTEKEAVKILAGKGKTAIDAQTGKIDIGIKKGAVKISGDVVVGDQSAKLNLGTNGSTFNGDIIYKGNKSSANVQLYMANGAVWNRESSAAENLMVKNLEVDNKGKTDLSTASRINQIEGSDLSIDKLKNSSGLLQVLYTSDEQNANKIKERNRKYCLLQMAQGYLRQRKIAIQMFLRNWRIK